MPATIAVRPAHPDLDPDRAWQQGRRLYARCGPHTRLSEQLHAMGAKWDTKAKALWVGSGKRDRFIALTLDHQARAERAARIKAVGHWVALPWGTDLIRARVKQLGGVWDREREQWAMPDPAAHIEVLELLEVWQRARDAEAEEQRRAHQEQCRRQRERDEERRRQARLDAAGVRERERRAAARSADAYRASLASAAGRTLTGAVETRREVFPQYTSRDAALDASTRIGQVLRLRDGRRALVTDRTIAFVPADQAHLHGQDRPHRYVEYQLALLRPTPAELDAEQERAAEQIDAAELHHLVAEAGMACLPVPTDQWTAVPDRHGTIMVTTGVNGLIPAGQLILALDGTVWWQHPGHYDDYIPAEGHTRDPGLANAVRHALAGGRRRRTRPGHPPLHYQVTPDA